MKVRIGFMFYFLYVLFSSFIIIGGIEIGSYLEKLTGYGHILLGVGLIVVGVAMIFLTLYDSIGKDKLIEIDLDDYLEDSKKVEVEQLFREMIEERFNKPKK